jgi:hypothetical protein
LSVAALGAYAGGSYCEASRTLFPPSFYQQEFAPAVLEACGRGFRRPEIRIVPSLDPFVGNLQKTFNCEDLPPDLVLHRPNVCHAAVIVLTPRPFMAVLQVQAGRFTPLVANNHASPEGTTRAALLRAGWLLPTR